MIITYRWGDTMQILELFSSIKEKETSVVRALMDCD
jgi:hypothetical protein